MAAHLKKQISRYTRPAPTKTQKRRVPAPRDYALTGSKRMKKFSEDEAKAKAAALRKEQKEKKNEEAEREKIFKEELSKQKLKTVAENAQMREEYAAQYTPPGTRRPPANVKKTPKRRAPEPSEICSE